MENFPHSQYSLCNVSYKVKTFLNLLILYIVKNEAILDINLCSIKLPELCEFDPKTFTCRITMISLFIKLNTLNCFPSADITLQECSQDNNPG